MDEATLQTLIERTVENAVTKAIASGQLPNLVSDEVVRRLGLAKSTDRTPIVHRSAVLREYTCFGSLDAYDAFLRRHSIPHCGRGTVSRIQLENALKRCAKSMAYVPRKPLEVNN